MKRALSAALLSSTVACAAPLDYINAYTWDHATPRHETIIRIDQRADAAQYCSATYGAQLVACADNSIAGGLCIITIPPGARPDLLAHEALHCFGFSHGEGG